MAGRADEETDPEDLRDDLVDEITGLHGDLKRRGYEQHIIPEFLNATRALALDARIPKLRKQIERMRKRKGTIQQDDHM